MRFFIHTVSLILLGACGQAGTPSPGTGNPLTIPTSRLIVCDRSYPGFSCSGKSGNWGFVNPSGLAENPVDHTIWVANYGVSGNGTSLSVVSPGVSGSAPSATIVSGAGYSFLGPERIAFDSLGTAWITNRGSSPSVNTWAVGSVVKIPLGGGSPTIFKGAFNYPYGIALDSSGNVWVASPGLDGVNGNSVAELVKADGYKPLIYCQSFLEACPAGVISAGLGLAPLTVLSDTKGDVFVISGNRVGSFTPVGGSVTYNTPLSTESSDIGSMAMDPSGNLWAGQSSQATGMGSGPSSVTQQIFEYSGQDSSPQIPGTSPATWTIDGGIIRTVRSDGAGNIWAISNTYDVLIEMNASSGYAQTVYCDPSTVNSVQTCEELFGPGVVMGSFGFSSPGDMIIDHAGNVWVSNGTSGGGGNSVTEIIGVATP